MISLVIDFRVYGCRNDVHFWERVRDGVHALFGHQQRYLKKEVFNWINLVPHLQKMEHTLKRFLNTEGLRKLQNSFDEGID